MKITYPRFSHHVMAWVDNIQLIRNQFLWRAFAILPQDEVPTKVFRTALNINNRMNTATIRQIRVTGADPEGNYGDMILAYFDSSHLESMLLDMQLEGYTNLETEEIK